MEKKTEKLYNKIDKLLSSEKLNKKWKLEVKRRYNEAFNTIVEMLLDPNQTGDRVYKLTVSKEDFFQDVLDEDWFITKFDLVDIFHEYDLRQQVCSYFNIYDGWNKEAVEKYAIELEDVLEYLTNGFVADNYHNYHNPRTFDVLQKLFNAGLIEEIENV